MPSPSITDLQSLEAAVRTGSFSKAARELEITQQGVSARVRRLERLIEIELVQRSHAGVTATEAGQVILAKSRALLAASSQLDKAISALQTVRSEFILVGASQTVAAHLLPEWLLRLRRAESKNEQPATGVRLRTENSETVIAMVRSGELDLGFIETPIAPQGLGAAIIRQDEMIVAVSARHPWAERDNVSLREIACTRLVSREVGSGTRAAFELAVMEKCGVEVPEPMVVLGTEAAIRAAVAHGVAPAVLSSLTVQDDIQLGRIRALPFSPQRLYRPLRAIWRGGQRDLTGARRKLVALSAQE